MKPRRPRPGVLRRERRALLETRSERLQEVGGLLVEMYRRGKFRRDVLSESCAAMPAGRRRTPTAEIDDILQHRREVPRCDCGAPMPAGRISAPTAAGDAGGVGGRGTDRRPDAGAATEPGLPQP